MSLQMHAKYLLGRNQILHAIFFLLRIYRENMIVDCRFVDTHSNTYVSIHIFNDEFFTFWFIEQLASSYKFFDREKTFKKYSFWFESKLL